MTGKTHRVGGMVCVLGGFTYLESQGLLLRGVNPLLQLAVMYPFALYGSTFCDLDQGRNSIPSQDIFSVAVNRILHLGRVVGDGGSGILSILDAKHRSWQTHSDLFLGLVLWLMGSVLGQVSKSSAESIMVTLIGFGFLLGVISHLILDMLTPEGVWSVGLSAVKGVVKGGKDGKVKISLVPDWSFFRTGGYWESVVRWILWLVCVLLFVRIVGMVLGYDIYGGITI